MGSTASLPTEAVDKVKHRQQSIQDTTSENTAYITDVTDITDITEMGELTDIKGITEAADLSNLINLEDRINNPVTKGVKDIPDVKEVYEEPSMVNLPPSSESLEVQPIVYEEELENISDIEAKFNQEPLHVNGAIALPNEKEPVEEIITDISVEEVVEKKGKQSLLHEEEAAFFGSVIEGINADEKPKQPVLKPIDLSVAAKEDTASAKQSQLNYVNNPPLNTLTGRLKWGLASVKVRPTVLLPS